MNVTDTRLALRIGALLAWAAATFYALIALGIPYPDLGAQRAMFALAGAAYLAGGAMLWRGFNRRLIALGAIANVAVMVIWALRAATGGSPADGFAIASKVVELALEVVLLALLFRSAR
jgi:hypothetical protein